MLEFDIAQAQAQEVTPDRTLAVVESEIIFYRDQMSRNMLAIGQRLIEAQLLVPRGGWQDWLEHNVQFSYRTAARMMQAYRQFGDIPQVAALPASQIYALLELPAEEAVRLVADEDLSGMSARELQEAVRARKEAEDAVEAVKAQRDYALAQIEEMDRARVNQGHLAVAAAHRRVELDKEIEGLKEQLRMAQDALALATAGREEAVEVECVTETTSAAEWAKITPSEWSHIKYLDDPALTAEHIENVLNLPPGLQAGHREALGFYRAVQLMVLRKDELAAMRLKEYKRSRSAG